MLSRPMYADSAESRESTPSSPGEESGAASHEVLIWDDSVHERLEDTHLFFWRLAFAPRYPKDEIFKSLKELYEHTGVTSHIEYETLGDFDLLLRLWIPRKYVPEEIELLLRQYLQSCSLWNLNYLACKTALHWTDPQREQGPTPATWQSVSDEVIRAVNDYNAASWRAFSRKTLAQYEIPADAGRLIADGTLRRVSLDVRGIRFFITFDHPRQPFRPETRDHALALIRAKCEDARDDWLDRPDVEFPPQVSIYAGAGTMTDFLVMVRAPHPHFHAFVHDLVLGLTTIGLDTLYEMRTYTHVIADRMFSDFSEYLAVADTTPVSQLVKSDEDETLEFKATLGVNIRSLVMAQRRENDPTRADDVVRAICGLLNSPKGGKLIIGVLEVRREVERTKDPEGYLAALAAEIGYSYAPPSDEAPRDWAALPNAIIGIEMDLSPGPFTDLEKYLAYLRDTVGARISPSPWSWLRVDVVEVEGKRVCVVTARPADVWFYARTGDLKHEEFFVRELASTRAYAGAESDLYKRANPRSN